MYILYHRVPVKRRVDAQLNPGIVRHGQQPGNESFPKPGLVRTFKLPELSSQPSTLPVRGSNDDSSGVMSTIMAAHMVRLPFLILARGCAE